MQNSCIPPINVIIHTKEGHPATGSPKIIFRTITNIIKIKEFRRIKEVFSKNKEILRFI